MIDYKLIGKRIKNARNQQGMTQDKLSELLGITPEHLSRLERGATNASLEMIVKISDILLVEPERLIFGAIPSSKYYLHDELNEHLERCSPEKLKTIVQIAKMIADLKDD